jgi:prepilin-type N-terminal cleavage/methylation domain-containing protein
MRLKLGFTLVELSIVLLIIGLIIGGITAGSSLIKQSQVRAVISEYNQYISAINNFKIAYNALPGDISNASTLWPSCTSATGDGGNCNGNADGVIGVNAASGYWQGTYNTSEGLRAWQHLSLAGIINGSYSGFGVGSALTGQLGVNTPASKYPSLGYSFISDGCYPTYQWLPGLSLGPVVLNNTLQVNSSTLSGLDAYAMDTKLDDGMPRSGKVTARSSDVSENCGYAAAATSCVRASNNSYYLNNTGSSCILYYNHM